MIGWDIRYRRDSITSSINTHHRRRLQFHQRIRNPCSTKPQIRTSMRILTRATITREKTSAGHNERAENATKKGSGPEDKANVIHNQMQPMHAARDYASAATNPNSYHIKCSKAEITSGTKTPKAHKRGRMQNPAWSRRGTSGSPPAPESGKCGAMSENKLLAATPNTISTAHCHTTPAEAKPHPEPFPRRGTKNGSKQTKPTRLPKDASWRRGSKLKKPLGRRSGAAIRRNGSDEGAAAWRLERRSDKERCGKWRGGQ